MGKKVSAEATIKDICRQSRRQHEPRRKSALCWMGYGAKQPLLNCAGGKGSRRACTPVEQGIPANVTLSTRQSAVEPTEACMGTDP